MTDSIVKTVTVPVAPEQAFARFTSEIMRWWPVGKHSVSAGQGQAAQNVVIEPREGGAVYEVMHNGARAEWGVVTSWMPPHGFEMTWHPGRSADAATVLTLAFKAVGDTTEVTLTHSGWSILAEQADDMRQGYNRGWHYVLGECYAGGF